MSNDKLKEHITKALEYNQLEQLDYFLYQGFDINTLNEIVLSAANNQELELLKFLFSYEKLCKWASPDVKDKCLFIATISGRVNVVKTILNSPKICGFPNIDSINLSLTYAADYGRLDIVKFLLTSSELQEKANIHTHDNRAIKLAAKRNHLDIVKYLVSDNFLPEKADVHCLYENISHPLSWTWIKEYQKSQKEVKTLSKNKNTNKKTILVL